MNPLNPGSYNPQTVMNEAYSRDPMGVTARQGVWWNVYSTAHQHEQQRLTQYWDQTMSTMHREMQSATQWYQLQQQMSQWQEQERQKQWQRQQQEFTRQQTQGYVDQLQMQRYSQQAQQGAQAQQRQQQLQEAQRQRSEQQQRQQFEQQLQQSENSRLAQAGFLRENELALKAREESDRAGPVIQAADDKLGQAVIHSALARSLLSSGDTLGAFGELERAQSLATEAENNGLVASVLRTKGDAYLASGNREKAIESYLQARTRIQAAQDRTTEAELMVGLAWVYQTLGEPTEALKSYNEALELVSKNGDRAAETRIRTGMGLLYRSLGQGREAAEQYEKAFYIAPSLAQQSDILLGLGEILQSYRYFPEALAFYEEAQRAMKTAGNRAGEAEVLLSLGRLHLSQGSTDEALKEFERARELMRQQRNLIGEAATIASIGEAYFSIAQFDPLNLIRKTYFPKVLSYYQEALALMRTGQSLPGEIGVLTNIGLLYDLWNKPRVALEYYLKAIAGMENLRTAARLEEFRTSLAQQSIDVYQRAIGLHVQLKQGREAFELTELARARTLLDELGNVRPHSRKEDEDQLFSEEHTLRVQSAAIDQQLRNELARPETEVDKKLVQSLETSLSKIRKDYELLLMRLKLSDPDYASFLSIAPIRLSEVQQQLDAGTTLVSYFVIPDATLAFVITRNSFNVTKLAVTGPAVITEP